MKILAYALGALLIGAVAAFLLVGTTTVTLAPLPGTPASAPGDPIRQGEAWSAEVPETGLAGGAERRELWELMGKIRNEGSRTKVSSEAIETFLAEQGRTAGSLIAAWAESKDEAYLREALKSYPEDPRPALTLLTTKLSDEERVKLLEQLKLTDPANALVYYLAGAEAAKRGDVSQALDEMEAASGQITFTEYSRDAVQEREALFRSAGMTPLEAKLRAMFFPKASSVMMSDPLAKLRDAVKENPPSPEVAVTKRRLGMALLELGGKIQQDETGGMVLNTFGMGMAANGLQVLEEAGEVISLRPTVEERRIALRAQSAEVGALALQFEWIMPGATEAELAGYLSRWESEGELPALKWLAAEREKKAPVAGTPRP